MGVDVERVICDAFTRDEEVAEDGVMGWAGLDLGEREGELLAWVEEWDEGGELQSCNVLLMR